MSKISEKNAERIKQEIARILFESNLVPLSTKAIADELIRDDEMVLRFLKDLQKHKIAKMHGEGKHKKKYWTLTSEAYVEYKKLL